MINFNKKEDIPQNSKYIEKRDLNKYFLRYMKLSTDSQSSIIIRIMQILLDYITKKKQILEKRNIYL